MPYARFDETLEAEREEETRRIKDGYRRAAFIAYLTTPNPDRLTFEDYCGQIGLGTDVGRIDEETDEDRKEAIEVCRRADELAKAGAYSRVTGIGQVAKVAKLLGG